MTLCACLVAKSCPTLCDPIDYSQSGSSVHGIFQARNWSGLPFSTPGYLPDSGIQTMSLASPGLAGGFSTASGTWENRHSHRSVKK